MHGLETKKEQREDVSNVFILLILYCRHSLPTEWLPIAIGLHKSPNTFLFIISQRLRHLEEPEQHLESIVPPRPPFSPAFRAGPQFTRWPSDLSLQFWLLLLFLFCNFGCIVETCVFPCRGASHTLLRSVAVCRSQVQSCAACRQDSFILFH